MYLAKLTIENFRCFGEGDKRFEISLEPGLTAMVGENDSGKTAVIDALRFALGTSDQEWNRLEDDDFNANADSREIRIVCKFEGLSLRDKRTFVEYLTYGMNPGDRPVLYVNWTAKDTGETYRGRPYRRTEVRSGENGDGPQFDSNARDLLRATYLRPLRDTEQALSAGRGSRLAQILQHSKVIREGETHDVNTPLTVSGHSLSILGIAKLIDALVQEQKGVKKTRHDVDAQLKQLVLSGDSIASTIKISGADASDDIRVRQLLEKLDLTLGGDGKPGLGSNNLLFMACELLLLTEEEGTKLLLIEEPEAHLHAQRQLRAVKFLQEQAVDKGVQVIVTTHSPNLASAIDLNNVVMIHDKRAFSMAQGQTALEPSDYRFLQRFLDVTKANLFFARGVMIVEGDAENILLPTLSRLIGRDFTEHGVSIVNVGGVGLRRYARVFQRRDAGADGELDIPVACVTDMDVMPDCAEAITGKTLATKGALGTNGLAERKTKLSEKTNGQMVRTFVADEWTLEYDLAFSGLAKYLYVAAHLAKKDAACSKKSLDFDNELQSTESRIATREFLRLKQRLASEVHDNSTNGCSAIEVLALHVYAQFTKGTKAPKPMAAQYLANRLEDRLQLNRESAAVWRTRLPKYLIEAIEYVTGGPAAEEQPAQKAAIDE